MIKDLLRNIIKEHSTSSNLYKRNLLKEYLQIYVLDFIYSSEKYKNLVFYGGSCLSQCYDLPRLSEDLDFVDIDNKINMDKLAFDLEKYFKNKTDLELQVKQQKFRIYLKFPILSELGLASSRSETDLLYLKVEIFKAFNFCDDYKLEVKPLFKSGKSLFVKTFDLGTLMSTKVRAVLNRKWEKSDKKGNVLINVKGRDYFDLMWYLERGVKPNFSCIDKTKNAKEIKEELLQLIEKVDTRSIKLDLENFIEDKTYLKNLEVNIRDIVKRGVEKIIN